MRAMSNTSTPAPGPSPAPSSSGRRKRRLEAFRHRPTLREVFTIWAPTLLLVFGAFWLTYHFLKPAPPDSLTLGTGAPDGAYHQYALKYRDILARDGVRLELKPSTGSVENLKRLKDPRDENGAGVEAAFIQGGLGPLSLGQPQPEEETRLFSLGNLAYEAVWVFTRGKKEHTRLTELQSLKVAIGAEGSGTRKVALDLFAAHGVPATSPGFSSLSGRAAIDALKAGQIDAMFLLAAPEAPVLRELAALPGVAPMSFANAPAIARRFPYLTAVTLARGVFDLKAELPAQDVHLVATRANLVIRDDLHPALTYLLLAAAAEVHPGPGLFHDAGTFPSPNGTDFPLAEEARRFYKDGRPFLQRYLPYWLANLVQRMIVFLIPIFGVVVPVFKFLPVVLNWRRRQHINRWYGELKFLELERAAHPPTAEELPRHRKRLEEIEAAVQSMKLPLDFTDRVYTLRQHIDFVRERLQGAAASSSASSATTSAAASAATSSTSAPSEPATGSTSA
jgi:TRAP-type uncharacterized transport system substrate-binding protein